MVSARIEEMARLHRRSRHCQSRAAVETTSCTAASTDVDSVLSDDESCKESSCGRTRCRRRRCDCAAGCSAQSCGRAVVSLAPRHPPPAAAMLTWANGYVAVPHWADIPSCTPERVVVHAPCDGPRWVGGQWAGHPHVPPPHATYNLYGHPHFPVAACNPYGAYSAYGAFGAYNTFPACNARDTCAPRCS